MYWYTLTPCDEWSVQRLIPAATFWGGHFAGQDFPDDPGASPTDAPLLPTGHQIVAALRNLLHDAIVTLRGPFLCWNDTLYFPNLLSDRTAGTLVPVTWLPEQISGQETPKSCVRQATPQRILWDSRKPVPLVSIDPFHCCLSYCSPALPARSWLSFRVMLQRLMPSSLKAEDHLLADALENSLENEFGEQPWTIETQEYSVSKNNGDRHNFPAKQISEQISGQISEPVLGQTSEQIIEQTIRLNSGWKFAIALDSVTHHKLNKLGKNLLIDLGDRSQKFWLQPQEQPFQQQWRILQEQSERNRRMAQQRLNQQSESLPESFPESMPESTRVLAYLATPGVFERKYDGIVTCRSFPWEWDLAYPGDRHQPRGPLVSLATTHPMPISCRCLSRGVSTKDITGFQVFAVLPGSVYYLEYAADLFQNQPFLKDGRPNKAHFWRRLGYSELFWMPYPNYNTVVSSCDQPR